MEVIICTNSKEAAKLTAKMIANAINENPNLVLGLATGATMEPVYAELVQMNCSGKVDFKDVVTFNLDEYVGLGPNDKNSYRYYMDSNLFDKININKEYNTHLPNGLTLDYDKEAEKYEKMIDDVGGIDLQLLGIGNDGHIGFNEPMSSFSSKTRVKVLTPETFKQNRIYFNPPELMPKLAFTMGVGTILNSKQIVMLITGKKKANIAAQAIEGPLTSMVTGSAIQLHQNVTVILDEDAASNLKMKEYYDFAFKNNPKWAKYQY